MHSSKKPNLNLGKLEDLQEEREHVLDVAFETLRLLMAGVPVPGNVEPEVRLRAAKAVLKWFDAPCECQVERLDEEELEDD